MKITFSKIIFVLFGLLLLLIIVIVPALRNLSRDLINCLEQNIEMMNQVDERAKAEGWDKVRVCLENREIIESFDLCIEAVKNKSALSKFSVPVLMKIAFLKAPMNPEEVKELNEKACGEFSLTLGWNTYRDEERGFKIEYPKRWKRLDEPEIPKEIVFAVSKEGEYASIFVTTLYILEKPIGVDNLKDWEELKIQGEDYKGLGLEKQFIKSYTSDYETGVYCRLAKDLEEYNMDLHLCLMD